MGSAVVVENLGKRFSAYASDRPRTIMQAALSGLRNLRAMDHFWALRNVSFSVESGEILGVIGHNGAGKSTLLQLMGGIGRAEEGSVRIRGSVGALLDLGAGFHDDLTGRENLMVTALISGLTRQEALAKQDEIIRFAELEAFIDNPIRTYSTGMGMRLAFSIAIHTNPDVLLVDEHLSVGDIGFQTKCLGRVRELRDRGCAIVLISQSPKQILEICDRALLLKRGRIAAYSDPETVILEYEAAMHPDQKPRLPSRKELEPMGQAVQITAVRLDPQGVIRSGDPLLVEIDYACSTVLEDPIFLFRLTHEKGAVCFEVNTRNGGVRFEQLSGSGTVKLNIGRLDLNGGKYFAHAGVHGKNWKSLLEYKDKVDTLVVEPSIIVEGLMHPPCEWSQVEGVADVETAGEKELGGAIA